MTHTCHWPGCTREVPPAMFACKPHWFSIPKNLRDGIWRTYRPGQEVDKRPSPEYMAAAANVYNWIRSRSCSIAKTTALYVCQDCGQWWNNEDRPPSCPDRKAA